jgi:hypothetical protein
LFECYSASDFFRAMYTRICGRVDMHYLLPSDS